MTEQQELHVKFFRNNNKIPFPNKAHPTDSGYDICWWDPDPKINQITLWPHTPNVLHTGIYVSFSHGYELQVRSKSGLASKGIVVANSPGTVDYGYSGEIKVILMSNMVDTRSNAPVNLAHTIHRGAKIAQLVFNKLPAVTTETFFTSKDKEVIQEELKKDFSKAQEHYRGEAGFGSTGK